MFYRIVNRDPSYPSNFSPAACDCIGGLLKKKEEDRLGCGELAAQGIKNTNFFSVIDFEALYKKEIKPPFKPDVSNEQDTTYVPESLLKTEAKDSLSDMPKKGEKNPDFEHFTFKGDAGLDD